MILQFPTLDTLSLVLSGRWVPSDTLTASVRYSTTESGVWSVEFDGKLTKKNREELEALGISVVRKHSSESIKDASSWLELAPVVPSAGPILIAQQAPVLFVLSNAREFAGLVAELLRLGNDRQSYRWLSAATDTPDGSHTAQQVLLRVIGPPYYTLLRAIDNLGASSAKLRAYAEQAPGVWVSLGFMHPYGKLIRPDSNQILLIDALNSWTFLPDAQFQDVYETVEFPLPASPSAWDEQVHLEKLSIELKLVAGNAADQPELWVLEQTTVPAVSQLEDFVRNTDDRLNEQLLFAIVKTDTGAESVLLKTRPNCKQIPVLEIPGAVGYKPYWRLPNLFLPVGTRLHPTLRRDIVSQLLADDRDRVVWLAPAGPRGQFVPHSASEHTFRPLSSIVEYLLEHHAERVHEWIGATKFDFESFICTESGPGKPKGHGNKPGREAKVKEQQPDAQELPTTPIATRTSGKRSAADSAQNLEVPTYEQRMPSEWKLRCDELETEFLSIEAPLDSEERIRLWPLLAEANTALGDERKVEAALCWLNTLWFDAKPASEVVKSWAAGELGDLRTCTWKRISSALSLREPTAGEVREFAVGFLFLADQEPKSILPHLPALGQFFTKYDDRLPIRAAWFVGVRLAELTGNDVLGLARVRDRVLNRLLERGLSAELDLPAFLRYAGLQNSDRLRGVQDKVGELHHTAHGWAERSLKPLKADQANNSTPTLAYLDLMFAFAFAKLGEVNGAQKLCATAKAALTDTTAIETKQLTGGFLYKAFKYRIDEAIAGRIHGGLLAPELLEELASLDRLKAQQTAGNTANNPYALTEYVIARMREQSKILEPQEKPDPYGEWMRYGDELKRELAELPKITDHQLLGQRIRDLFFKGQKSKDGQRAKSLDDSRFIVLLEALPLAARVGQDLTVELLKQVPAILKTSSVAASSSSADLHRKQGQLLELAIFLAAHFDRTEIVQELVDQFLESVGTKPDEQRFELVNAVAGQSLRSLRKVGLRDQIDKMLRRLQDEVLKGKTLAQLKLQYNARPDLWSDVLQTMLNFASGWLTFGLVDNATPILDAARAEVLTGGPKMAVQKYTRLCQAYLAAVGQSPTESGMPRYLEFFQTVEPARITNTFTTGPYYSRLHLNLIEETVLSLVNEEFTLGQNNRRWLDEDEHLIRRRIHNDMRKLVAKSGL